MATGETVETQPQRQQLLGAMAALGCMTESGGFYAWGSTNQR